jgi:hypothetical protein
MLGHLPGFAAAVANRGSQHLPRGTAWPGDTPSPPSDSPPRERKVDDQVEGPAAKAVLITAAERGVDPGRRGP